MLKYVSPLTGKPVQLIKIVDQYSSGWESVATIQRKDSIFDSRNVRGVGSDSFMLKTFGRLIR